jgi:hypothetical protein
MSVSLRAGAAVRWVPVPREHPAVRVEETNNTAFTTKGTGCLSETISKMAPELNGCFEDTNSRAQRSEVGLRVDNNLGNNFYRARPTASVYPRTIGCLTNNYLNSARMLTPLSVKGTRMGKEMGLRSSRTQVYAPAKYQVAEQMHCGLQA